MNKLNIDGYERISKHEARTRHYNGMATYALPHKMRPGNMWMSPAAIPVFTSQGQLFSAWVAAYTNYNCNYESGYYLAFYKKA